VARQSSTAERPLGRGPPRSRAERPLRRGPPRSRAERPLRRSPPRSRVERPLGRGPPRSRAERPLGRGPPRSMAPTHATPLLLPARQSIQCSDIAGLRHDPDAPGITPRRCSSHSLGKTIPPLYNTVWRGQCQPRGTVPPTFIWLTRRALEGGRQNPRMLFL
jgi:hypothetical protein